MLSDVFSLDELKKINIPIPSYTPFPTYSQRDGWRGVVPETAAFYVEMAETFLDYEWPAITASMYLALKDTGELKPHWDRFRQRRAALGVLALAECIEGKGRFFEQVINGIVATLEETAWISPLGVMDSGRALPDGHCHTVDLCSSETAALLAWIDYLFAPELDAKSPQIRIRIGAEIKARIIIPYLDRDDYWWMGFTKDRVNNWNPWCNMNVIMCLLLKEEDPETRARSLHKVLRSLDRYIETYAPDGCCDEGPMYWGAAGAGLFVCVELLSQASGGRIHVEADPRVRLIGEYITKVFIHDQWFVDFADGDAHVSLDSATYRYGKALGNRGMMGLSARARPLRPTVSDWFRAYQHLMEIFTERERTQCAYEAPYLRDSWLWHTGVMTAREHEGSPRGLFLAAKAGNNLESHNHNDVGNFIVYADGHPVLIDIGTEEYSLKTFSPQRYEIWYIQSQYHNCPGVRGIHQNAGGQYRAEGVECVATEHESSLTMELNKAYPDEAGIKKWRRSIRLICGEAAEVAVTDYFSLATATDEVCRYLITPCEPAVNHGEIALPYPGGAARVEVDPKTTRVEVERIPIAESRLRGNWGDMLYRIVLRETAPVETAERDIYIRIER